MTTVTIRITRERLAAMDDNEMVVYGTPNTWEPYWASRPSFMYDKCLATPRDFYEFYDLDREDCDHDEDEILELTVVVE
jgi:hypothetical protein